MHRRSRLLTVLAALSVLLSIAMAALWVRSLTTADQLKYSHPTRIQDRYARIEWSVFSGYGFLSIGRWRVLPPDDMSAAWLKKLDSETGCGWSFGVVDRYPPSAREFVEGFHRIGFFSGTDTRKVTRQWWSVEVPNWLLLLVVSIPAQTAFVRMIRARGARHRNGFPVDAAANAPSTGDGA